VNIVIFAPFFPPDKSSVVIAFFFSCTVFGQFYTLLPLFMLQTAIMHFKLLVLKVFSISVPFQ